MRRLHDRLDWSEVIPLFLGIAYLIEGIRHFYNPNNIRDGEHFDRYSDITFLYHFAWWIYGLLFLGWCAVLYKAYMRYHYGPPTTVIINSTGQSYDFATAKDAEDFQKKVGIIDCE